MEPAEPVCSSNFESDCWLMGNHDAILLDRVDVILSTSPYLSRRKVRLETESGRVTLRGEVDSFFQKQMAQEAIRRLDGVREILNELEVVQFS